jgi:rRNA maturation protein Nop10
MAEDRGAPVPCEWCGQYTSVGAACDTCGSPMQVLSQCRYCGDYGLEEVCTNCLESLSTMSNLVRHSPEKPLLKQAIDEVLNRAPSP